MQRNLIEKGRAVHFKSREMKDCIGVVVDFQTQTSFVVQLVCVESGKAKERVVVSGKSLLLLDSAISIDDSEEVRGDLFAKSIEEGLRGQNVLEQFRQSPEYLERKRAAEFKKLNDFERFMGEEKERIKQRLLQAKGL